MRRWENGEYQYFCLNRDRSKGIQTHPGILGNERERKHRILGRGFANSLSRGLSKVAIFVTDNFSGLDKLISKLFPLSDHQFCFIHLYRNLKNKLTLKSMKELYKLWQSIIAASDIEEGRKYFGKLLELVKEINPEYARYLQKYSKNYLAFLNYPEEIRKHIYTTNVVESINAGLEYMRMEHGGYFASWKMLELNLFIQLANMHDRWIDKPIPNLAGVSYRLKRLQ